MFVFPFRGGLLILAVAAGGTAAQAQETWPQPATLTPAVTPAAEVASRPAPPTLTAPESGADLREVQGNRAVARDGEAVGEVQDFVRSADDGSAHALLAVGGPPGEGERLVAIPLRETRLTGEGGLQILLSDDEIRQREAYDEARFHQIPESEFAALEAALSRQR